MLKKITRQNLDLPFTIKNKTHYINIGLIILVIISSIITWFLTELIVYQLNHLALSEQEFIKRIRPDAMAGEPGCYIDYEGGNDQNSGLSKDFPWKHHPWDISLAPNSNPVLSRENCKTYYFKKGVVYRGTLSALDSGTNGEPIILGADSSWGTGDAQFFGSEKITSGWTACSDEECAKIPAAVRNKVWYRDTVPDFSHTPMMLYEIEGDDITKLNIARSPNWTITNPDDPKTGWWEFTGYAFQRKLTLDNVSGFNVNDVVYNPAYAVGSRGVSKIYEVGANYISVAISQVASGDFAAGNQISNGTATHIISAVTVLETKYKDTLNLTQEEVDYWKDGDVWYEDYAFWPRVARILSFDPVTHEISFKGIRDFYTNKKYYRYFIEGLPELLDSENEWIYINSGANEGRIYLMLSSGRDPNETEIEIARNQHFLKIDGKQYITVQGLHMKFFNGVSFLGDPAGYIPRYSSDFARANNPEYSTSVIRITGSSSHIKVSDCDIEYANQGIGFFPDGNDKLLENLTFDNNHIAHMEANAINGLLGEGMGMLQWAWAWWPPQKSRIRHIEISHNTVEDTGLRTLSWNQPGAIGLYNAELAEVAYNNISQTATPGINFDGPGYWDNTKGYWEGYEGMDYPLQRVLIHHNTLENTCLMTQDMGGIEIWHGGPTYVYDNLSGNAVGSMYAEKMQNPSRTGYYRNASFAPAFYSDNGYKNYIFNNIFWGKNNDEDDFIYNSVGYYDYDSLMDTAFNNTIYNVARGIGKGGGMDNRSRYLNNLLINIGGMYIEDRTVSNSELESMAYADNIYNDQDGALFGRLQNDSTMVTYNDFVNKLTARQSLSLNPGQVIPGDQVLNEASQDFHLKTNSSAVDTGKKVFVPWSLYEVAGEWGFYKNRADITQILDEHINWNSDFWTRDSVRAGGTPRRNLTANGISSESFQQGTLEQWIDGAMQLNGINQYCSLANNANGLLDMTTNNLLMEAVIKIESSETNGGIVEKTDGSHGYSLRLENGKAVMELDFGGANCSRISAKSLNDGAWHHILAEADRSQSQGINIYVDGQLSNGAFSGMMNEFQSLTNESDFIVGRAGANGYLAGTFDFLRISRGTLADAETDINELYEWEFNGPFLRDYDGNAVYGASRDVGAMEYVPPNQAPSVNAGSDQSITLPQSAALSGQITDDGLPNPPGKLTLSWSKISGPGDVTFTNISQASTAAAFSLPGTYILRLTANDSLISSNDEIRISVNYSSSGNGGGGGSGGSGGGTDKDIIPPAAIKNISFAKINSDNIVLTWIALGDDNNIGRAIEYDIRYSTSPINDQNWDKAVKVKTLMVPKTSGSSESLVISNLEPEKNYYFAMKAKDKANNWSGISVVVQAKTLKREINSNNPASENGNNSESGAICGNKLNQGSDKGNYAVNNISTLFGQTKEIVECLTREEAKKVEKYNSFVPLDNLEKKLYLQLARQSKMQLTTKNKYSLAMFIHYGTEATLKIGAGERAGVINSYAAAFHKIPKLESEWQDVIKIANGRWPNEKNTDKETETKEQVFKKIYKRSPDMKNGNDNAAVTIITYGLRPAVRNTESEKTGIKIFKGIYGYNPISATEWDAVRAIAYSGCTR